MDDDTIERKEWSPFPGLKIRPPAEKLSSEPDIREFQLKRHAHEYEGAPEPTAPRRKVAVDAPAFGGRKELGDVPYYFADPISQALNLAYGMKTAPLYSNPYTAPVGRAIDAYETAKRIEEKPEDVSSFAGVPKVLRGAGPLGLLGIGAGILATDTDEDEGREKRSYGGDVDFNDYCMSQMGDEGMAKGGIVERALRLARDAGGKAPNPLDSIKDPLLRKRIEEVMRKHEEDSIAPNDPRRLVKPEEYRRGNLGYGQYALADGGRAGYATGGEPALDDAEKERLENLYQNINDLYQTYTGAPATAEQMTKGAEQIGSDADWASYVEKAFPEQVNQAGTQVSGDFLSDVGDLLSGAAGAVGNVVGSVADLINTNKKHLIDAMNEQQVTDPSARNAMAANVEGETGFQNKPEISYAHTSNDRIRKLFSNARKLSDAQLNQIKQDDRAFFNLVYGNKNGNKGGDDGYNYRGRGAVQLTGAGNYQKYGQLAGLGDALVKNPDLMNDPAISARVSVAYMKDMAANHPGKGIFNRITMGVNPNAETVAKKLAAFRKLPEKSPFSVYTEKAGYTPPIDTAMATYNQQLKQYQAAKQAYDAKVADYLGQQAAQGKPIVLPSDWKPPVPPTPPQAGQAGTAGTAGQVGTAGGAPVIQSGVLGQDLAQQGAGGNVTGVTGIAPIAPTITNPTPTPMPGVNQSWQPPGTGTTGGASVISPIPGTGLPQWDYQTGLTANSPVVMGNTPVLPWQPGDSFAGGVGTGAFNGGVGTGGFGIQYNTGGMFKHGGAVKPDDEDVENALRIAKRKGGRINTRIDKDPDFDMSVGLAKGGRSPAWTRKEGQNPEGGLNAKGRASAKAEGSNLKPPAPHPKTDEAAARRKSFCARMKGMKAKLTSSETANDPDSRINRALRVWNCHSDGGAVDNALRIAKGGEVWDKTRPKSLGKPEALSKSQKQSAKASAKAAGRPYPNLVDNMRAAQRKK